MHFLVWVHVEKLAGATKAVEKQMNILCDNYGEKRVSKYRSFSCDYYGIQAQHDAFFDAPEFLEIGEIPADQAAYALVANGKAYVKEVHKWNGGDIKTITKPLGKHGLKKMVEKLGLKGYLIAVDAHN